MNIAIITAGGTGSRLGNDIPKQFITVNDKLIITYTLEVFQKNKNIDVIIVACLAGWSKLLESHAKQYGISKLKHIVEGGKSGQLSILNCLNQIKTFAKADDLIIIHDGNRPLVTDFIINENIKICNIHGNAITSVPVYEPVFHLDPNDEFICSKIAYKRESLTRSQTPQTIPFAKLCDMYETFTSKGLELQAASNAIALSNEKVFFSPGSELNFKITTQEDLDIFKSLIKTGKYQ